MKTALFFTGRADTGYRQVLTNWATGREDVDIFTDGRYSALPNQYHYLNYYRLQKVANYRHHIYIPGNDIESAQLFPFMVRFSGYVFLDSSEMDTFTSAVSHSRNDPVGTGFLLEMAGENTNRSEARLNQIGIAWKTESLGARLAAAVAILAEQVVVADFQIGQKLLFHQKELVLHVLPYEDVQKEIGKILSAAEYEIQESMVAKHRREELLGRVDDFRQQQHNLIRGQFSGEHQLVTEPLIVAFDEFFDKIVQFNSEERAR